MKAHARHCAPEPTSRNPDRVFSVRLASGEVVFTGALEDALRHNRELHGQSVVWSDDERPMTLPKLAQRRRLADYHVRGVEFMARLGPLDVPGGGGMRAVQDRAVARVRRPE